MAFSLWIIEERKFEMKKHLLLTGLLAILTFNSAQAQGYYYQNGGYYEEAPLYQQQVVYQQPQYREVQYVQVETPHHQGQMQPNYRDDGYVRQERPRYRRVTNADARRYEERKIYKSEEPMINKIRPYIGLDIGAVDVSFDKDEYEKIAKDKYTFIDGVLGARGKYLGIEAFYQQSSREKKNLSFANARMSTKYKVYGADLIGYIPVYQDVEILLALGLGRYDMDAKIESGIYDIKGDAIETGFRMGVGAQYNLTDNIALRGMLRYVKMKDGDIKSLVEASLGIRYMF